MKKFGSLLLLLAMLALLAACGGAKTPVQTEPPAPAETAELPLEPPAPTEAPAPSEAPEATEPPTSAYPVLVPIGEEYAADLNGDGVEERICVSLEATPGGWDRAKLTLNGVDCTDSLYAEGEVWLDSPDPDFWAITDLYSVDNLLEIAVQDWGPSSDYYTNFLRYDGESLYPIGGVEGLIWSEWSQSSDLSFEEDGFIRSYMRLSVLQTWFAEVRYELSEREWLDVVPQDLYTALQPTPVTVTSDILGYDTRDVSQEARTLAAGTKLTVLGTDNAHWVQCTQAQGETVWLYLAGEGFAYQLTTPDGGSIACWEALDGLCMAD